MHIESRSVIVATMGDEGNQKALVVTRLLDRETQKTIEDAEFTQDTPFQPIVEAVKPTPQRSPINSWSAAQSYFQGELLEHSSQLTRMQFPILPHYLDIFSSLQSGVLGAFFDVVMDACILAHTPNRRFATIEHSVRFFRALKGGSVIVDAAILRAGRTTITLECLAWDAASELCSKGMATKMFTG